MWNVITFEVFRALKKKSFWIASIAPLLIILVVFGLEHFSIQSSKTTSAQQAITSSQNTKISVLDDSGLVSPQMLTADHISSEPTKAAGIAAVKSGELGAFFYYPADVSTSGIQVYSQDQGIGQTPYNDFASSLLKTSVVAKVKAAVSSTQSIKILEDDPPVVVTTYKNGVQTAGIASVIAPGLFAAAFLLLIILLLPFMISSTAEEKENRVAEILLTSINASKLIGGKIVSILILGIVQLAVIVVPVIFVFLRFPTLVPGGISLSSIPLNPVAIAIGALFLAAGFALYVGLLVGVGSMVPGTNNANRFIGVFVIWVYIPIYTISLVILNPQSTAVTILTYFPLTAPTMALLRNALGSLSIGEAVLSFAIVVVSAIIAIWFAIRAFRYGSMEHGRTIRIKELFR
jgi:ABC-2 type transport system permease protein